MTKLSETKKKASKGITLIRKSNDLIEARYKFDIWETRFFLAVLAQIRREDDEFKVYRIRYRDIVNDFGLKTHQSYDMLREGAKKLMNKSFYVSYEENGKPREVQYHILRKLDYSTLNKEDTRDEGQEYIDLTIEQEMKPFLLQLSERFTTYDLRNVTKLGTYPIRIYELLKQYELIGSRKLVFDEFKRMLELEKEYPRFPNFYQKIVQPAIRDINKYTDLTITEVEKLKEGKKIVDLRFHFKKKSQEELDKLRGVKNKPATQGSLFDNTPPQYQKPKKAEVAEVEIVEFPQTEFDRVFTVYYQQVVENLGVSPIVFADLVKHHGEKEILYAIEVTQKAKEHGIINSNISGHFVKTLKSTASELQSPVVSQTKEWSVAKPPVQKAEVVETMTLGADKEKLVLELSPLVVVQFGVSLKVFMSLVEQYTEGAIKQAAKITEQTIQTKKVENIAGFFVEALRGGYVDVQHKKKQVEDDKKAKAEAANRAEEERRKQFEDAKKAHYVKELQIFERLLETDPTFETDIIERVRYGLLGQYYKENLSFEENLKSPMLKGAILNIAKELRPQEYK